MQFDACFESLLKECRLTLLEILSLMEFSWEFSFHIRCDIQGGIDKYILVLSTVIAVIGLVVKTNLTGYEKTGFHIYK